MKDDPSQPNQGRYTPDSSEHVEKARCTICKTLMNVERNINGATSGAEARSGQAHLHDRFTCPYLETDWHKQVIAIYAAAKKQPSAALTMLLEEEAKAILESRKATKQVSWWNGGA